MNSRAGPDGEGRERLAPALIVPRWIHEGDDEGLVLDLEELDEAGAVARLEREAA